jgi:Protein of unknown function DUF262/Protein of unknown function (DUF1524)
MQPTYLSLTTLFGVPARYTVPLFQRSYVWNKEEQWVPLWDDISNLADRVLNATPGKPVAGHFLGTVVLEQAKTIVGSIGCREIIDGQQRLTTLQILLRAADHALTEAAAAADGDEGAKKGADVAARQVAILTGNAAYFQDEEKYKVWPTNDDRAAFCSVMDAMEPDVLVAQSTRMAEAYRFFREEIQRWLNFDLRPSSRPTALAAALQTHLRLIVLDLDDTDEPQAIFETLNAHGVPLLPADLIKNWLLWEAARQGITNVKALYEMWWRGFDRQADYWRTKVGTGHAARPRVDTFLQNWLSRRIGDTIPPKHLYHRFQDHVTHSQVNGLPKPASDIPALMQDIHQDGLRYKRIDEHKGSSRFDTFLRRLSSMDIVVFHPVLLAIMGRSGSDQADLDAVGVALESYLVRRIVCSQQTRGYAEVVMKTLLAVIRDLDANIPAAPALTKALVEQSAEAYRWPEDESFKDAWLTERFYGGFRRSRVMMILQALEEHYQRKGTKGEPIVGFDFSNLEIEHILPQKWKLHWPLPKGESAQRERERKLHGIGNLTLVSGKLNPALSNAAWLNGPNGKKGKRGALDDHSKLQLNATLVKAYPKVWNEAAIGQRAATLFESARQIWPPPPALGTPT